MTTEITHVMQKRCSIISGASSGIGSAIAEALADRGDTVALLGRDPARLQQTADRLRANGADVHHYLADVADRDTMEEVVANFVATAGRLDAFVHSAGVHGSGSVDTTAPSEWDDVVRINLTGTFNAARCAMPHLLNTGGSFVAIGSVAGVTGSQNALAYAASKHGVTGLVRSLALDFGPRGVRINQICPGIIMTPMAERGLAGYPPEVVAGIERSIPAGRFARADEVAKLALYLTSPDSAFVNGASFMIDGGATAGLYSPA
jgi:meso-butanediol dehydrogenase/(S,S)-butanediol dehydrogenase/diacetyl reductase